MDFLLFEFFGLVAVASLVLRTALVFFLVMNFKEDVCWLFYGFSFIEIFWLVVVAPLVLRTALVFFLVMNFKEEIW